jgi:F-type H+-transporting ATPase subunit beta
MDKNKKVMGKISQIIGAVVDVTFDNQEDLPSIYDALIITRDNGTELVLECEQDIGENTMRCIAMDSTDYVAEWM